MNNQEKNTYVKKHISDALLTALKEQKLDEISVRDLCSAAGVGRASFYRNYQAKEDVIREHADNLIKQWGRDVESVSGMDIIGMFTSLFKHYKDNYDFYSMLYEQNMSDIILKAICDKVELSDSLNDKEAYDRSFFAYGIYGLISQWIKRGMKQTPEELVALIIKQNPK